ncbi:HlyD family type I secretion periplasmic adaptor subunit [Alsobacter sp. R-9]
MARETRTPRGDWRPAVRAGAVVIVLTFGVFGGWSAVARLDAAVVAPGRITLETDRQLVQHLEGGIVAEILVTEDRRVEAGEVLVRIDPMASRAAAEMARNQAASAEAEEARLIAEIERSPTFVPPALLTARAGEPEVARALADQSRAFDDRRSARANEAAGINERIAQAERQIEGLNAQLASARSQVKSFTDEMARLRPLELQGLIQRPRIQGVERQRTEMEGRIGAFEAEVARLGRVIAEARLQVEGIDRRFVEEASARLVAVRRDLSDARERRRVAEDQLRRAEVRAPRSGRIVNRRISTVGAVVRPGEVMMEIVPEDDVLVVSARLSPIDITHVHPSLPAEVRLPAFKSRTTPIAVGEVRSISADALVDEATRQPYYAMQVSVRAASFPEGMRSRLVPGMPADVVIATGERTVLDYLVQPLSDALRRGMREN